MNSSSVSSSYNSNSLSMVDSFISTAGFFLDTRCVESKPNLHCFCAGSIGFDSILISLPYLLYRPTRKCLSLSDFVACRRQTICPCPILSPPATRSLSLSDFVAYRRQKVCPCRILSPSACLLRATYFLPLDYVACFLNVCLPYLQGIIQFCF